jgi:plastocyanin
MNKTYVLVLVLVLVVLGGWYFIIGKQVEAPKAVSDEESRVVQGNSVIDTTVKGEVREFVVSGQNFSFTPSVITVKKGDKVKITFNNTQGFHDFKIDEYGVASKQSKSPTAEVLEFTADKAGSFEYYCSVGSHRAMGMKGTLKVE